MSSFPDSSAFIVTSLVNLVLTFNIKSMYEKKQMIKSNKRTKIVS